MLQLDCEIEALEGMRKGIYSYFLVDVLRDQILIVHHLIAAAAELFQHPHTSEESACMCHWCQRTRAKAPHRPRSRRDAAAHGHHSALFIHPALHPFPSHLAHR